MPLVNGRILLDFVKEKKVIAGAFNTTNLETTVGILKAIEKSEIPTFIQVAPTNITLAGYSYIVDMLKTWIRQSLYILTMERNLKMLKMRSGLDLHPL